MTRLFTPQTLRHVQAPWRWQIVSSLIPIEAEPAGRPALVRWLREHSHSHPFREILVPLRGRGAHGFRGDLFACRPGVVFLFDAYESHDTGYPPSAADLDHLWLTLIDDLLLVRRVHVARGGAIVPGGPHLALRESDTGVALAGIWTRLKAAGELPASVKRLHLVSALGVVLAHVIERDLVAEPAAAESAQQAAIEAIKKHLRATAGAGATLDTLARIAGYSKYHFLRVFQRLTGQTVHQYINLCRVQRVREMECAGRTHKEMSYELGFSCPSAFSRWYRSQSSKPDA